MTLSHVVVDGSNIATEGRTKPSLKQLDEAIEAFRAEHPEAEITVIVDATFGHRISSKESDDYEARVLDGSIVAPPAGVVGRGDAFILQVADKVDASVLSNDSFQEFHGEHTWLFDEDRLWGGKPVTGVGWVFVARTPVRGSVSRRAVKEAKTDSKSKAPATKGGEAASKRAPAKKAPAKKAPAKRSGSSGGAKPKVGDSMPGDAPAPARARTSKRGDNADGSSGRGGKSSANASGKRRSSTPDPVNSPGDFLRFIGEHQPGGSVTGTVVEFSSHGAYLDVDGTKAYLPLKALADPPPNRARDYMSMGDRLTLEVEGYDPPLRSVDHAGSEGCHDEAAELEATPATRWPPSHPGRKSRLRKSPAKRAREEALTRKAPLKKAPAKAPAKSTGQEGGCEAPRKSAAEKAPAAKGAR
ncbi:MAG: hypothetical protein R2704_04100 [Microthrixaceae bacterium]